SPKPVDGRLSGYRAAAPGETCFLDQRGRQLAQARFEIGQNRGIGRDFGFDRTDQPDLRLEQARDVAVQRPFRMEIFDGHAPMLPKAIASILGLGVIGWNPVEVLEDYVGAGGEGNADAASDYIAYRDLNFWIGLEPVDC